MPNLIDFKIMRIRKGLTQADVAKVAGVTQQAVSDWESGRRMPSKTSRDVLAKVLGVSAATPIIDDLVKMPTCTLCDELRRRVGVQEIWVEPYKPFEIINDGKKEQTPISDGACRIFVVWD